MANITDIHCTGCGSPAHFDIIKQTYLCGYCGASVEISEALKQKQGFRELRAGRLKNEVNKFNLFSASCSGCGATVVFEENEALSSCAFCGRSLVRKEYLDTDGLPESIIPFSITQDEAAQRLKEWCLKNKGKPEAKKLKNLIPQLKGFYLPYELVRGPVHLTVSRMSSQSVYSCEGFLNDEFVNCSKQLDNLLLDGMEPFDTEKMVEFDFAYVGGHRVKISDISDDDLAARISAEARSSYTPSVRRTLESHAVEINADAGSAVRYPVLLPVYYICEGNIMAAVNGQTGKVSVRAEKESHYHFLPWWFKALAATLALTGAAFSAFYLFGIGIGGALYISALLGFFLFVVAMCVFSDTTKNKFSVESGRKIYNSGRQTFRRERGGLVQNEEILKRKVKKPVYFSDINGSRRPVELRFTTPVRIIRMILLSIIALFLPVFPALLINGFNLSMINLSGSAVWFCLAVPLVPVFLLNFGIVRLHDNPWIYYRTDSGRKKRYRKKTRHKINKETVKDILMVVFVPPASLAVWFGIISFCVIVYLTAGYDV